jgi:uncharacterized protein YbjT (DUF2867 family)
LAQRNLKSTWATHVETRRMQVLVTGATGYIGGRLVPRLLEQGHQVRVMVRDPARVQGRAWASRVEVVAGDILQPQSLAPALQGMDAAYYLIHSMLGEGEFASIDRQGAQNFVGHAGHLKHLVYLGGLLPQGETSKHLSSRAEVGDILRAGLPTTEFRAGPIVGSGSASFEMVRYLAERVPFFLAPRGVHNAVQPIGVSDTLTYLVRSLERGAQDVVEIGTDRSSFGGMLTGYANVRGLKRPIWETPLVPPAFCARMVGLLTPIPTSLAAPLLEGVKHAVIADTRRAEELFPEIRPLTYEQAIRRALERSAEGQVETSWRSAQSGKMESKRTDWEGLYQATCSHFVPAPPENVFRAFCSLGGDKGYVVWNWAWRLRGWIDQWIGGPGLRRGRRHPYELLQGEAMDVWRVELVEPPHRLFLSAEMKLPGRAWLSFEARPENSGTRLVITALMEPHGVPGWLYWWSTYPYHRFGFQALARALADEAVANLN